MRHLIFKAAPSYPVALLIKATSFKEAELRKNYLDPLIAAGCTTPVIAFTLSYNTVGKAPAKHIKDYLVHLLQALTTVGVQHLYVADAHYFKVLTGKVKADPHLGYVLPCRIKGYEHLTVILGVNYQSLIFQPTSQAKLDLSLDTLVASLNGTYSAIGTGIIHSAGYPGTSQEVRDALQKLHAYPELVCDIEGFSLRFDEAGIGTVAFAWDEHNGIAFAVDYQVNQRQDETDYFGYRQPDKAVRALLKEFFETYQGKITWHASSYDLKAIIYTLWMKAYNDIDRMLQGLDVMTRSFDDTKLIAYLATNSTAGNHLGLKTLAHEFAGNWAVEEIKDIRKIPLPELLQYNLVDCLSTWYVKKKLTPIMIQDQQEELYRTLMLPAQKLVIQIELVGMPMSHDAIDKTRRELQVIQEMHLTLIKHHPVIKTLNLVLQQKAQTVANSKLKVKVHPLEKFDSVNFNPGSSKQLQLLLYEAMGLPVTDYTDTKQPSTDAKALNKLFHVATEPAYKDLLKSIIGYAKVTTVLNTFIPAFENGIAKLDGMKWLHGSIHVGGARSGRNTSSDPNLNNIPANSTYAKLIKECFVAPPGWLLCGADFNSLEDMVSGLISGDPNRLKVYSDGYDSHSFRAFAYFPEELPGIVDTVASINSIADKFAAIRQDSKPATFLLTYMGTYHGLMANLGWPEEKAKRIEANYHKLYQVNDDWVQARLKQANQDGHVTVAFGLRVRTPLLKQIVWGSNQIPYEAQKEKRTAGNAMGQSYGLLTNRAAVDFMEKVWASEYRLDILPLNIIHDAIYILVRNKSKVLEWANRELIKSMQWQELPELAHPTIKLGAVMDIFWPSWAHKIHVPNDADEATLIEICRKAKENHGTKTTP